MKSFATPEDLYKYMKSAENPFKLGEGARRNTNKNVVGIVWEAAYKRGRKDEKSGAPKSSGKKSSDKGSSGKA